MRQNHCKELADAAVVVVENRYRKGSRRTSAAPWVITTGLDCAAAGLCLLLCEKLQVTFSNTGEFLHSKPVENSKNGGFQPIGLVAGFTGYSLGK